MAVAGRWSVVGGRSLVAVVAAGGVVVWWCGGRGVAGRRSLAMASRSRRGEGVWRHWGWSLAGSLQNSTPYYYNHLFLSNQ